MWEEIRLSIFDAASATGLNLEFLGNMIAETYGLIFGALISVLIANLLDSRREGKRQADHRVRAANRWIKSHYDMLLSVREAGGQGDGERRKSERRDTVRAAIQHAEAVKEDYSEALDAPKITGEFMKYVQSLERLAEQVYKHAVSTQDVRDVAAQSFDQLQMLIETTSPRKLRSVFREPLDNVRRVSQLDFAGRPGGVDFAAIR